MTLRAEIGRLKKVLAARKPDQRRQRVLVAIRADRSKVLSLAGVTPDRWQADLLRAKPDATLALCSRQSGKSLTAAGDCLTTALVEPGALVLILSPTLRQSVELYRKALALYRALGRPVPALAENRTALELSNGSRIVALPGDPAGVVGFSAPRLVVIDEAARAKDDLYVSIRPMLATGRGRLLLCSSAFGCRGFFHGAYTGAESWHRVRVTAHDCPRITAAFLERERLAMGDRWFRQEYECSFEDATDAVFSYDDVAAALQGWDAPVRIP